MLETIHILDTWHDKTKLQGLGGAMQATKGWGNQQLYPAVVLIKHNEQYLTHP